jgi:hypothetical protein
MSNIEMACTRLKDMLGNPSAVQRYTTMHDTKYVHPGWVDYQKRCTSRPWTGSRYLSKAH